MRTSTQKPGVSEGEPLCGEEDISLITATGSLPSGTAAFVSTLNGTFLVDSPNEIIDSSATIDDTTTAAVKSDKAPQPVPADKENSSSNDLPNHQKTTVDESFVEEEKVVIPESTPVDESPDLQQDKEQQPVPVLTSVPSTTIMVPETAEDDVPKPRTSIELFTEKESVADGERKLIGGFDLNMEEAEEVEEPAGDVQMEEEEKEAPRAAQPAPPVEIEVKPLEEVATTTTTDKPEAAAASSPPPPPKRKRSPKPRTPKSVRKAAPKAAAGEVKKSSGAVRRIVVQEEILNTQQVVVSTRMLRCDVVDSPLIRKQKPEAASPAISVDPAAVDEVRCFAAWSDKYFYAGRARLSTGVNGEVVYRVTFDDGGQKTTTNLFTFDDLKRKLPIRVLINSSSTPAVVDSMLTELDDEMAKVEFDGEAKLIALVDVQISPDEMVPVESEITPAKRPRAKATPFCPDVRLQSGGGSSKSARKAAASHQLGLFAGRSFFVTSHGTTKSADRVSIEKLIKKEGGHLVTDVKDARDGKGVFACVSDVCCITEKYLFSLSRCIPIVSFDYVRSCLARRTLLDIRGDGENESFLLPADLNDKEEAAAGDGEEDYQVNSVREPVPQSFAENIFKDLSVLIILSDEKTRSMWSNILTRSHAKVTCRVPPQVDSNNNFDFVLSESSVVPQRVQSIPRVSCEQLILALKLGRFEKADKSD